MSVDEITKAYLGAVRKWTGCDWDTRFGRTELKLRGLKASQAALMAQATAGAEAEEWRAAARWLTELEGDAQTAERAAELAVQRAADGRLGQALEHARQACTLEAKYRTPHVWQPLCDAVEAVAGRRSVSVGAV